MKIAHPVLSFGLLALAALAAAHASAQPRPGNAIDMLARADDNRDGSVTDEELRHSRRVLFERLDVNHDQRLTHTDRAKWARLLGAAGSQAQFEQFRTAFDADQDGGITRAEFVGGPALAFDILDADHNKTVDAAEFASARAAHAASGQP